MNKVVLDASALLALVNEEKGAHIVEEHITNAMISSVNLSEAATVLIGIGMPKEEAEQLLGAIIPDSVSFDHDQAYLAASLRKTTRKHGLSFGDRACLSLALLHQLPVITADKVWSKLDISVDIKVIR